MATKTITRSTGKRNLDCQPSLSMNIKERWRVPLFPKKMSVGILRILQSDLLTWLDRCSTVSTLQCTFRAVSLLNERQRSSLIPDLIHVPRSNRIIYFLTSGSSVLVVNAPHRRIALSSTLFEYPLSTVLRQVWPFVHTYVHTQAARTSASVWERNPVISSEWNKLGLRLCDWSNSNISPRVLISNCDTM